MVKWFDLVAEVSCLFAALSRKSPCVSRTPPTKCWKQSYPPNRDATISVVHLLRLRTSAHLLLPRKDQKKPAPQHNAPEGSVCEGFTDAETDMLLAEAASAICVQRFDDSRNSAIHITYHISLRSSSLREPRYPLLRVIFWFSCLDTWSRHKFADVFGFGRKG